MLRFLVVFTACLASIAAATRASHAAERIHLRMDFERVVVEAPPLEDPTGFSGADDWFFIAALRPVDGCEAAVDCRAYAESYHSRFIEPDGLDFVLRFEPGAGCEKLDYELSVFGYTHALGVPIDLNGAPGADACPRLPVPPGAMAGDCTGRTRIRLDALGDGAVDGGADGQAGELDGLIDYRLRVASTTLPLAGAPAPPGPAPWLVRVRLGELEVDNELAFDATDWRLDVELASADGKPGCRVRTTSPHTRFLRAPHLDLVLPEGDRCAGRRMQLRLVAYTHASESLIDLGGSCGGVCDFHTGTGPEHTPPCEAVHAFALDDGYTSGALRADGHADGNRPGVEWDAALPFEVEVMRGFEEATVRLDFEIDYPEVSLRAVEALQDVRLDVQLDGGDDCRLVGYTDHSHFLETLMLDVVLRGPDVRRCLERELRVDLVAYDTLEALYDLDPTPALEGGSPCPWLPPLQDVAHALEPLPELVESLLYRDCRLGLRFDPRLGPYDGFVDAAEDHFADVNDLVMDFTLRAM